MENKIIRKQIKFFGRVQGVGFRFRAQNAANHLGLTGWIRNEWDDTVLMVVQGKREDINEMVRMLQNGTFIYIEGIESKELPLEEGEHGFRVRGY